MYSSFSQFACDRLNLFFSFLVFDGDGFFMVVVVGGGDDDQMMQALLIIILVLILSSLSSK